MISVRFPHQNYTVYVKFQAFAVVQMYLNYLLLGNYPKEDNLNMQHMPSLYSASLVHGPGLYI